uniref:GAG-pre-integrase domain-containing protein n=1 Tax=Cannabis sativa TaxID=3483 RepID=A0A803Q6K9_CANSA
MKKFKEIQNKAHSAILLSLGDEVLREVSSVETAVGLWKKLASIYLKKSLANKLYLKKKLYTMRMDETKDLRIGTVRIKFHDDQVMKGSLVVMKGELKNGIYYLKGKTITGENDMVVRGPDMESTRLWHLRLGHVSERGMSELEKQGILQGKLGEKLDFCDDCVYGFYQLKGIDRHKTVVKNQEQNRLAERMNKTIGKSEMHAEGCWP